MVYVSPSVIIGILIGSGIDDSLVEAKTIGMIIEYLDNTKRSSSNIIN